MKRSIELTCLIFIGLITLATCGGTGGDVVAVQSQDVIANTELMKTVAKEFYRTHPDQYDMLVVWGSEDFSPGTSFYLPIKNELTGLGYRNVGDATFDHSADYGSNVLQGMIWIGPNWINNADTSEGPRSNLGILAQETAHRWAATVHYIDPVSNDESSALLEDSYHWNFYLSTGKSPLGGNEWESLGDSLYRARPVESVTFCPLDLYLMGLIPAGEVGTITLLTNPQSQNSSSAISKSIAAAKTSEEVTVQATPVEITIDQIVAAEGNREPATGFSAATIRQAWIYLYNKPSTRYSDLSVIEQLRLKWRIFFFQATGEKAEITTTLH